MASNVDVRAGWGSMIARGTVEEVGRDGSVTIAVDGENYLCDVLSSTLQGPSAISEGDDVLIWLPEEAQQRGVVIGGISNTARRAQATDEDETGPEELVISARKSLTLKVGDGSITIREDGRILIKGKDLVSHAKRMNRIRGGSVQIN